MVWVVAHTPELGVKTYGEEPGVFVFMVVGFQVPAIIFGEVPGSVGGVLFRQKGPNDPKSGTIG